jgi:hypothetical protein
MAKGYADGRFRVTLPASQTRVDITPSSVHILSSIPYAWTGQTSALVCQSGHSSRRGLCLTLAMLVAFVLQRAAQQGAGAELLKLRFCSWLGLQRI